MVSGVLSSNINQNPCAALAPDSKIPCHQSLKRPWNIFSIDEDHETRDDHENQLDLMMLGKSNNKQRPTLASSDLGAASRIEKTLDLFGMGDHNNSINSTVASEQPGDPASLNSPRNLCWNGNIVNQEVGGHDAWFYDSSSRARSTLQEENYDSSFPNSQSTFSVEPKQMLQSSNSSMFSPHYCKEQRPRVDAIVSPSKGDKSYPYTISKKHKTSYSKILEAALHLDLNLSPLHSTNNISHHSLNGCFGPIEKSIDQQILFETSPSQSTIHASPNLHVDQINLYENNNNNMVIVGCPSCLMYVMLCAYEPKCPKCGSDVIDTNFQSNTTPKKLIAHDLF